MIVWDEAKRKTNLEKHGLDFADADMVYENPRKITFQSPRKWRERCMSKRKSQSDWKRVKAIRESDPIPYSPEDGPYGPNDAKAAKAYLSAAIIRRPGQRGKQKSATKQLVSLRLSPAVVEYFKATGPGWQTRIDEALKKVAEK
jgi:uncharacterized protein (DUF4415 family)